MKEMELYPLLQLAQGYLSAHYAQALVDRSKGAELRAYIAKYLYDTGYTVAGFTRESLTDRLYAEMAEYSVLTPWLKNPDIEEINVNGWDDIALTHLDGRIEKLTEHFFSPGHAVDVIKKLLHHSGMIIDSARPMSQGHLPGNTRITVLMDPIVDGERRIAASIRMLRPQRVDRESLLRTQSITDEMLSFLEMCLRFGVSFVVAGRTSSGKTTLLNSLLNSVPDSKRIYTIESGARELSLLKRDAEGRVINNVVHTLSRPSENPNSDISQEDLVMAALRFDPDVICVGEMRDAEAHSAVEASSTDHTVVTTVHGGGGIFAHQRIAFLSQRRFPIDFSISMRQAAQAFPVVVFAHKLEDNSRKVMDISECVVGEDGGLTYRTLYKYHITDNRFADGAFRMEGEFCKENTPSPSLCAKLMRGGVPQEVEQHAEQGSGQCGNERIGVFQAGIVPEGAFEKLHQAIAEGGNAGDCAKFNRFHRRSTSSTDQNSHQGHTVREGHFCLPAFASDAPKTRSSRRFPAGVSAAYGAEYPPLLLSFESFSFLLF